MSSERSLESKTGGKAATTGIIPGDFAISVGNPQSDLPKGWSWQLLTDVARLETGHTPSRKHPEYWGGTVPWIGIRDATGSHGETIHSTAQYTNELGIRNSSARILPANTVCLSRTASVGYVIVMGVPMATSQDFVNWVCGPELNYLFLKYVLLAERDSFLRFASGTTHQTIYFPEVKAFHIALPPRVTQDNIVDVLQVIDDRITLLRETNATLEAIAQALFKSWFVDFDPVHANAGTRPATLPPELQALFPSTFTETAQGLVPEGWEVCELGKICRFQKGCSYKGVGLTENEGAYMFNLGCFNAPRVFAFENIKRYVGDYKPRHAVKSGDLIVANTDMTQARDILGRPLIVPNGYDSSFVSHHVFKVEVLRKNFRNFLFFNFGSTAFRERAVGYATGTTVLALPRDALELHQIVVPPSSVRALFDDQVDTMLAAIQKNQRKTETLASLRDTLLPRLISGQLRLPEAEAALAEVVA